MNRLMKQNFTRLKVDLPSNSASLCSGRPRTRLGWFGSAAGAAPAGVVVVLLLCAPPAGVVVVLDVEAAAAAAGPDGIWVEFL